jgi:hypothetical protein
MRESNARYSHEFRDMLYVQPGCAQPEVTANPSKTLSHVKTYLVNTTDARVKCKVLTLFQGCAKNLARHRTARGDCKPQLTLDHVKTPLDYVGRYRCRHSSNQCIYHELYGDQ